MKKLSRFWLNLQQIGALILNLLSCNLLAQDVKPTPGVSPDLLKGVVSIELRTPSGICQPIGTGFLVATASNFVALVSAKHVVFPDGANVVPTNLVYRINHISGKSGIISDADVSVQAGPWFASTNSDIAFRFFPHPNDEDIKVTPTSMWLRANALRPGAPVVIFGFPMGLRSEDYPKPIVRRGIVASTGDASKFILDALVFPGNSGGPVYFEPVYKLTFGPGFSHQQSDLDQTMLIGVVVEYIPYNDTAISAQTKQPRVMFQENSGLALVVPIDQLFELMNREDVKHLQEAWLPK
jgi:hypothetical protein